MQSRQRQGLRLQSWNMNKSMRKVNIPIFVPHKGCPHQCSFCNQKAITGAGDAVTGKTVREHILRALGTMQRESTTVEVAFFGGSFTAIDVQLQEELLGAVQSFLEEGAVDGIRISTRPDCIDEAVVARLLQYGVTSVELGVQSSDDAVLLKNGRGHTFADVKRAFAILRAAGFEVGLQMMLGLYGSSSESDVQTARDIAALKPDTTRIYPTVVLEGSPLLDLYRQGQYMPLSLETAVETAATAYGIFKESGVHVLRMGLMASENLASGMVAGPQHPAFGELVFSRLYLRKMQRALSGKMGGEVTFFVHPGEISKALGNKKENKTRIFREQGVNIRIKENETVESGEILW